MVNKKQPITFIYFLLVSRPLFPYIHRPRSVLDDVLWNRLHACDLKLCICYWLPETTSTRHFIHHSWAVVGVFLQLSIGALRENEVELIFLGGGAGWLEMSVACTLQEFFGLYLK